MKVETQKTRLVWILVTSWLLNEGGAYYVFPRDHNKTCPRFFFTKLGKRDICFLTTFLLWNFTQIFQSVTKRFKLPSAQLSKMTEEEALFWSQTYYPTTKEECSASNIIGDELLLNFGAKFQR